MDHDNYDLGEERQAEKPKRPGFPVEPRRLIRILFDHRRILGRAFLAGAALSAVAFFLLPKTYQSDAALLYEGAPVLDGKEDPLTQDAFVSSAMVPSRLIEIRERLGWDVPLEELEENLEVVPSTETSVQITGLGANPQDAHALVRAALDAFVEHQLEFNRRELERLIDQNERSLENARERREQTQQAVDAFREESGHGDIIQERNRLLERMADLRTRRDEALVDASAQKALIAELQEAQAELPRQVVASARKGSVLEGPLAEARAELARARATLSSEHPRVLALQERVNQLDAQKGSRRPELSEQTLAINPARSIVDQELATARAALAAAEERKAALDILLSDVQQEAERLSPEEGQARRVLADLIAASERVDWLTQRRAELGDARLAPINRFRVLSPPVLPEQATRPGVLVMLVFMLPLLAVLGAAVFVIARALRALHIHAPREVAWWGDGPVLGTTVWPRRPDALQGFVDELEDQGVYGAGRTLVVPATEIERDDACAFAMKLAEAPWLAAAILDVEDRADQTIATTARRPQDSPIVTPKPNTTVPPRRLSSQASPSAPTPGTVTRTPSRPPRKKTVIGLPPVGGTADTATPPDSASSGNVALPDDAPRPTANTSVRSAEGPQPFRRKRGARATVRMIIPAGPSATPTERDSAKDEESAFLLTRPAAPQDQVTETRVGPAVLVTDDPPQGAGSNAVIRAAVRLLGEGDDDLTKISPSGPPARSTALARPEAVALAWNGPLSGPVLRRAARLAHRVIVVVSSGVSVVDLTRVRTRLGREEGVGYVLINVDDAFAEVGDRVGAVEEFWQGKRESEA